MSWPAIIVGLLLCLLPGLVLLWARPQSSTRTKGAVTAGLLVALVGAGIALPDTPIEDTTAAGVVTPPPSTSTAAPAQPSPPSTPTASATPSATKTAPTTNPAAGSALAAVEALEVKGRAPKTGYDRDLFGSGWVDVDRNGCDTRNDMLRSALIDTTMSGACKVLAGTLADPYTGSTIRFEYGGASEVDLDHIVALSDAWQKGAAEWPFAKKVAFANDPLNLQPADARANRQKGDADAATWLPSNKSYRCTYVAQQVAVKTKYELWVTPAEKDAMLRVLSTCPDTTLPDAGPQPTIAANTGQSR